MEQKRRPGSDPGENGRFLSILMSSQEARGGHALLGMPDALEVLQAVREERGDPSQHETIRFHLDSKAAGRWKEVVARVGEAAGRDVEEWEVLALLLIRFWRRWGHLAGGGGSSSLPPSLARLLDRRGGE
jgi:hypothetical protein